MATEKQTAANQLNAQKATGPRSAEGKAKSSQNALKTGLHAKAEIIATENPENYDTLIAEYYDRFHPATPEERCLVDNLIKSEWMGRRYMAATASTWEYDFRVMKQQDLGLTFLRNDQTLARAQRLITANQRNYVETLKQLLAIRRQHAAEAPPQPAAATEAPEKTILTPQMVSFFTESSEPHSRYPKNHPEHHDPPIAA